jgi:hypothetical protein
VNDDAAVRFEPHRRVLVAHAYRMLGEHAEAEDIVQEAYLRWDEALARTAVDDDRAFLRATVTRLALDRLRSARARREVYVGPWLPEPLLDEAQDGPDAVAALADDVSFALLLALERLSPLERAHSCSTLRSKFRSPRSHKRSGAASRPYGGSHRVPANTCAKRGREVSSPARMRCGCATPSWPRCVATISPRCSGC